jgi:hypothetical protein
MNETPDPLAAELSALRPHAISPALRQRVAGRLTDLRREEQRRSWRLALTGSLAAACLAAVIFSRWRIDQGFEPKPTVAMPHLVPAVEVKNSEPTRLAYWRALARSPEELDAFLDKNTIGPPKPQHEHMQISALLRSDSALHTLIGGD